MQLAIADLLVSLWCLSGEAAWTYTVEWKAGEVLCKIFKFSQVSLLKTLSLSLHSSCIIDCNPILFIYIGLQFVSINFHNGNLFYIDSNQNWIQKDFSKKKKDFDWFRPAAGYPSAH